MLMKDSRISLLPVLEMKNFEVNEFVIY